MLSLVVTNKSTEETLNQLGEYGWHTDAMSIVNEKSGTNIIFIQITFNWR